ncbi:hypothetical protein AVEN_181399-1 [Araneus ventricosus]|uniref:Uncharacterized protein n=1 Tax=Araneus ventricosus TaxID=182803 RepID=A0A4Y2LAW5_ARAVE|nr:hypothetical protein AVEN_181399-1 [Araneus ventricosus]
MVVQTPSTDNDKTIIYYSTPTSEKPVPILSSETTPPQKQSPFHYLFQKAEEDKTNELEIVFSSVKTATASSFKPPHSTKGILEIYSSLDSQDKVDFLETLNERERQALYNSLKDSPVKLQEWEELFKTHTETFIAAFAPIHPQEKSSSDSSLMLHISTKTERDDLNKSIHHLREIIHSKYPISMVPAPLRTKAEEFFSSIESQFSRLLSAIEVRQANSTTFHNKSTQAALPFQNSEAGPKLIKPPSLHQQESSCMPPPLQCHQSRPPTLLLYPTEQTTEEKVDLPNLPLSNLPNSLAKIVNIKNIKSNGLAISLASSEESAISVNSVEGPQLSSSI